ncbi:MarR family winged helix-turn-helix transcriptional regulator [Streptococcus mutans]|uniref:MarR family winged helix-turn-helix transcriptional regulator n=1 Tax=Streptococcus mutans TaxID=1309 RepID=UPI0002B5886D|nr:MarR family winged helix-turn-helix transcriptional regulator [Streptococcus mutans]EMC03539.1 putative transcriptional regulator, MarR family protein [Streptococcus mutans NFSM1]MCB4948401.1 MarR family winged helix-turn-helix transcriptional regulator [Streptococcus mutans]MCB4960395.1 MarR family winged helix-turn-helix transcriptional regulator [Streptococcus mutans]MCB5001567.1 MarR family winged helix-turn-helix transcriptional regulator [Streptococcus mutans]MCB5078084.1 MarR family 
MPKDKTFEESLNSCLFFTVKKLDKVLNTYADTAFAPTGLSPTYGFILLALEEKDGLRQKDLSQLLHLAPSTLTRFIEKLVYKQLVTTQIQGRETSVFLTENGHEMAKEVKKSWDALHDRYFEILGKTFGDDLAVTLNDVAEDLKD